MGVKFRCPNHGNQINFHWPLDRAASTAVNDSALSFKLRAKEALKLACPSMKHFMLRGIAPRKSASRALLAMLAISKPAYNNEIAHKPGIADARAISSRPIVAAVIPSASVKAARIVVTYAVSASSGPSSLAGGRKHSIFDGDRCWLVRRRNIVPFQHIEMRLLLRGAIAFLEAVNKAMKAW